MITPLKNIFFNVNDYCQYHCKYCWYRKSRDKDIDTQEKSMSIKTLEQAYNIFFQYQQEVLKRFQHNELNLIFATKEPLFEYKRLIYPFIKKLNKINLDFGIKFSILTNGCLLTPEISQFCDDYKIKLLISLDGNMISNNTNRLYYKDNNKKENLAFTTTMAGTSLLFPHQRHFTFTINKNTLSYLYDSLIFLSEYPHGWTRFNFNLYNPFTKEEWQQIQNIFDKFITNTPIEQLNFLSSYIWFSPLIDEDRGIILGVSWDGIINIKKVFHSSIPRLSINNDFYTANDINLYCGTTMNPLLRNLDRYINIHGINYSNTFLENLEEGC